MTPAESRDLTAAVQTLSAQLGETARLMVVAERERVLRAIEDWWQSDEGPIFEQLIQRLREGA